VTRQLQQSLLPPFLQEECTQEPTAEGVPANFAKCHYKDDHLRISGVYLPCDALGGDIYDVIKFPNGTVGVAVADVSGHGVPAGFITAIFKSSFYRITHNHHLPNDILFHLNNELADIIKTGEYVTAIYSRIRSDEQGAGKLVLDYSGAGHPYPYYYKASTGEMLRLQENGTPLVWIKNMQYPIGSITLEPGDKVLLFTDGLTEMRNTQGELYGEEALEALFLKLVREQSPHIPDAIIQHMSDYTEGHPLEDDLSLVLIEVE
jgi:sigma-B regulation protein RsbU (phosphoserine phosphatase)